MVGALPWAIAMMVIFTKLLVLLLTGGGLHYRRTKAVSGTAGSASPIMSEVLRT